jgi:hypothetical protein
MRRTGAAIVLAFLAGAAHAQDSRVAGIFGPTQAIRQNGQLDFINHYLTDESAIRALLDATTQGLRKASGSFSPGVYDAISVLTRVPPDSIADAALRAEIVRVAQASSGNSADTRSRAALLVTRFGSPQQPPPPPLPPLPNPPRIAAPAGPSPAQTHADYRFTVGTMTVVNGVSHRGENDYVSLVVIGPDGQIGPFSWGPQKLAKDDHPNLNLRSDTVRVGASNQGSIRVSWTAANEEQTSDGKKMAMALGKSAADVASGVGPYGAIIGAVAKFGLNLWQGCNAPLFGGGAVLYPDRLVDGQEFDDWKPVGPNRWRRVFEYPNVASPCDTGHYKLEVDVERGVAGDH